MQGFEALNGIIGLGEGRDGMLRRFSRVIIEGFGGMNNKDREEALDSLRKAYILLWSRGIADDVIPWVGDAIRVYESLLGNKLEAGVTPDKSQGKSNREVLSEAYDLMARVQNRIGYARVSDDSTVYRYIEEALSTLRNRYYDWEMGGWRI